MIFGGSTLFRFTRPAVGLGVAFATLTLASPAYATSSVTAAPAHLNADVGTKDLVSGHVTSNIVRTAVQYYSAGHWYTTARATVSSGAYHVYVSRTNNGSVLYRVVGVNSAGVTAAYSSGFRIRWFAWQIIGLTSSQYNGNNNFAYCNSTAFSVNCQSDKSLSFNGQSFAHSIEQDSYGNGSPTTTKFEYDIHLHGLGCDSTRWADGWSGTSINAQNNGTAAVNLDGNGVYQGAVSTSQATPHRIGVAGHDLVSYIVSANFYPNSDGTSEYIVLGNPAVHCYNTIP